jgi:hypothetical protein
MFLIQQRSFKPTIAVDFDGTICEFAYPDIGPPKPGVREALTRLRELGYEVIIYSCRTANWHPDIFLKPGEQNCRAEHREVVHAMRDFLDEHNIPYDAIDYGNKGKPTADFYIDDKGVRYDNNWPEVVAFVEART